MRKAVLTLSLLAACARPAPSDLVPAPNDEDPRAQLDRLAPVLEGHRADYILTWNQARVGEATERFFATEDALGGYRYDRHERVVLRRDGAVSTNETHIVIDTDITLSARRIVVERKSGGSTSVARAERLFDETWRVELPGMPAQLVDGAAIPASIVPLLVAERGTAGARAFEGRVLMEGAALSSAELAVDLSQDGHEAHVLLSTRAGLLRARAVLDDRGHVLTAGEEDGVASRRATPAEIDEPFTPPDVVAQSRIPWVHRDTERGLAVKLDGVRGRAPRLPEFPEQSITITDDGVWHVSVKAPRALPATAAALRATTSRVSKLLVDDTAAFSLRADDALARGRGDCTAHALVLEQYLRSEGYTTRLVTGLVHTGQALARHRWVAVRLPTGWVQLDPMFDEAPASAAHVALAVHGPDPEELAFVDEVTFAGFARVTAQTP